WKNCAPTSTASPKTSSSGSTDPRDPPGEPGSPKSRTPSSKSAMPSPKPCSTAPSLSRLTPSPSNPRPAAPARVATQNSHATRPTHACCAHGSGKPPGPSRKATAPAAGGLFSPQSQSLGLDQGEASPAVLEKIVYAGIASNSFAEASKALHKLAD